MENIQSRVLPTVDVAGVMFYADAIAEELIQVDNPSNRLSVLEMMSFDDHHEFLFDKQSKKIAESNWDRLLDPDRDEWVWIRPIAAIDLHGMEMLISEGKFNWVEHYENPLPVLKIAGIDFFIDPIRKGFREVDNRWNILLFTDVLPQEGTCKVYFDTSVRNVPFPHELDPYNPPEKLPAHIVLADVPSWTEIAKLEDTIKTVSGKKAVVEKNVHKKGRGL